MITNERQYRITKAQLAKLTKAVQTFDIEDVATRTGSKVLAEAELHALRSEQEVLTKQLREYEELKSGALTVLRAGSLEELPGLLIRARIAAGLSQRKLADSLGLKEQQIQRYESEHYASASLRRLGEVARALGLNVSQKAEIRHKSARSVGHRPKRSYTGKGKSAVTTGKFELKKNRAGHFYFSLKAANGQTILSSETYKTKRAAVEGIKSVRKNSTMDERFEKKTTAKGVVYFVLKASNGREIGRSETYSPAANIDKGIASVKINAPNAGLDDQVG